MENLDKIKEKEKKYRTKNKDKIKESLIEYRIQNLNHIKEGQKGYRTKNKVKMRENRMKKETEKNPSFVPNYSWKSREESRKNFESIASLFHITDLSDWYRISFTQIKQFGGVVL
jgi:hypothetical protein